LPRARIGALILIILYPYICILRLIKWLSVLAFCVFVPYSGSGIRFYISVCCISVYYWLFPVGDITVVSEHRSGSACGASSL